MKTKFEVVPYGNGRYMAVGNYEKTPMGLFKFKYGGGATLGSTRLEAITKFIQMGWQK